MTTMTLYLVLVALPALGATLFCAAIVSVPALIFAAASAGASKVKTLVAARRAAEPQSYWGSHYDEDAEGWRAGFRYFFRRSWVVLALFAAASLVPQKAILALLLTWHLGSDSEFLLELSGASGEYLIEWLEARTDELREAAE